MSTPKKIVLALCGSALIAATLFNSLRLATLTRQVQGVEESLRAPRTEAPYVPPAAPAITRRAPDDGTAHKVLRVVDGDTVEVETDAGPLKVRIIGIDTPETVHPSKAVEPGGPEASARAKELLEDQMVILHYDPDPNHDRWDKYGRLLAYLELPDGRDFGLVMVTEGYAAVYTKYPFSRQESYLTAAQESQGENAPPGGLRLPEPVEDSDEAQRGEETLSTVQPDSSPVVGPPERLLAFPTIALDSQPWKAYNGFSLAAPTSRMNHTRGAIAAGGRTVRLKGRVPMSFEWLKRAWSRGQRSSPSPSSAMRRIAERHILDTVQVMLVGIEEDPLLTPSASPAVANSFLKATHREDIVGPGTMPLAWGCLAGVVSLRIEKWLRTQMGPVLRDLSLICQLPGKVDPSSEDFWLGFEDCIMKQTEPILLEWGTACYGISEPDAASKQAYAVEVFRKSDCAELIIASQFSLKESSLLKVNLHKSGLDEHVVIWLTGIRPQLCGLMGGFLDEQLRRIPEEIRKEWNRP